MKTEKKSKLILLFSLLGNDSIPLSFYNLVIGVHLRKVFKDGVMRIVQNISSSGLKSMWPNNTLNFMKLFK